ncbi:glycosyltransferase family 4 protein, partial [Patescibacteria group bacterium]|nr:glycosyltransferase family 4 protein [Patescibacteria group bacterium]
KEWSKAEFLQFFHTTEYGGIVKKEKDSIKFILYFKDEIPADLQPTPTISPSLRERESQRGCLNSDLFETRVLKTRGTAKFTHWDLPRLAAKDKVDILFCPAYVSPIIYGGKIALTLHDISYEARPQEFNWPSLADKILLKWVSRQSAKKAGVIFTPSEFSRQEVIKYYGVPAERVFVTPLGVDSSLSDSPFDGAINVVNNKKFDSPAYGTNTIEAVKKKYGLSGKFIFYVGSIFTRRHLPEIISAFERLTKESNYQLLLGGEDYTDGKSVDELVKKINEKLGREAVLRVDFIDDNELKLLYSACAFFIWLSDYEGFGLPMLEAMSLGAPVITTDGSSLSEVAGEAALLIRDNADVEEIYRAMHKLARDSALREELIARGKEQAAKFSWQKCAERTLWVVKDTITKKQ